MLSIIHVKGYLMRYYSLWDRLVLRLDGVLQSIQLNPSSGRPNPAAQEEVDHLSWCQQRIQELGAHTSYLNPFWYISALLIGVSAGLFGDKVSLGFLAETEHQVARHLYNHLQSLPLVDNKSRAIVEQMRLEEMEHALTAEQAGAIPLPLVIQWSMQGLAKFMSLVAYRI
mgnify:CR=1 FL=1